MNSRKFLSLLLAVLVAVIIGQAAARNSSEQKRETNQFYVSPDGKDSDDGSRKHPWASLAAGAGRIPPGATVHVMPGTYVAASELKLTGNGLRNARITYVSDTPWAAKLVGKATGNSTVVWIKGDYVDFKGFDITGAGTMGIYVTGSNVRIIGNHVHNIPATNCRAGAGILNGNFKNGRDVDIISNLVHDVGDYNKPCALVHGIYSSNRGGHIINNISFRNQGWGIHTWHAATNVTIANNTVFNNAYGGIIIGAGDGNWTNDHSVVANNIVYRNGLVPGAKGNGIEEYGRTGKHNQFINNLVFANGPKDWRLQNGNTHRGTLAVDPQFVNYTGDITGQYDLKPSSPARSLSPLPIHANWIEQQLLPPTLLQRVGADLSLQNLSGPLAAAASASSQSHNR